MADPCSEQVLQEVQDLKFTIELDKDQAQRLVDAMTDSYEDLANKIKHLKGRVRDLERTRSEHIKRFQNIEAEVDSRISRERPGRP